MALLDKTGTLTTKSTISSILVVEGETEERVLEFAAGLEAALIILIGQLYAEAEKGIDSIRTGQSVMVRQGFREIRWKKDNSW